ncbi:hypothetical protein U5903_04215 [Cereibacter johrii]|uniref:hypothetical protein n=1 Tax=Cereibacter johrii TaxID=445629 RepID=UPI002B25DC6C|nr:hypothetical protein [Cereibacter johrii]MEA5159973.1 hypothetical protein [Cereibacter johrii]
MLIYVMSERLERMSATRGRGYGPIKRIATAEIVVICEGRDGTVVDQLDDMCRSVEVKIAALSGIELTGTSIEIDGQAQTVRAAGVLTLTSESIDTLTA